MTHRLTVMAALAAAFLIGVGGPDARADGRDGVTHFKQGRFQEALKELLPAAEKNDPAALYVLGKMHSAGLGVKADPKKAAAYFKRGAELGDAASQNDYGVALALGEGVEQNVEEAAMWLMISARQGHRQAQDYADRLTKYMPSAQVTDIRKMVGDWEAAHKARDGKAGAEASP
jgi:TPR repeat protein